MSRKLVVTALAAAILATAIVTISALAPAGHGSTAAPASASAATLAAGVPIVFEPNRGQAPAAERFFAHGPGYVLGLRPGRVDLGLGKAAVAIELLGAPHARPAAVRRLPGHVNYLRGRDARRWLRDLPTFGAVRYASAWPGIAAIFHGGSGRLEFDFDVAPGADPARIGLRLRGQRGLRLDAGGSLVIATHGGRIVVRAPVAYQRVGGHRVAVASRLVVARGGVVRVAVGAYDHRRPLVIDPAVGYSTLLGGTGADIAQAIAVGPSGGAYLAGFAGSGFPRTSGVFQHGFGGGGSDAFVTKIDATASGAASLVYSTYLGGSQDDEANAIATDGNGHAFVGGDTDSPDFPTTPGAFQRSFHVARDPWVAKLTAAGDGLTYSTFLTSDSGPDSESNGVTGLAVDATGHAYAVGNAIEDTSYPTTSDAYRKTQLGITDVFLTVLGPGGGALSYSTLFGGSGDDEATGVAIDSGGAAYLTGFTFSTDLPTTASAFQPADANGGADEEAWVAKIDPSMSGSAGLRYATYLGKTDEADAIAVDDAGHAFVTGSSSATPFPTTAGAFQTAHQGAGDAFVTKLSTGAGSLLYSTILGGADNDIGRSIAVDSSGRAFVAGVTASPDFPTGGNPIQSAPQGDNDAFVTKVAASGASLDNSTYLGGEFGDEARAIGIDSDDNVYVAGYSASDDFPIFHAAQATQAGGAEDAFFTKLVHTSTATVTCTPATVVLRVATTCVATVDDNSNVAVQPTGTVTFTTTGAGAFSGGAQCTLGPEGGLGEAICSVTYTPSGLDAPTIAAAYAGDDEHGGDSGTTGVTVTKRATSAAVDCPASTEIGVATACTAHVDDTAPGTPGAPTGTAALSTDGAGTFAGPCTLAAGGAATAACTVSYTPTAAGTHDIGIGYAGDATHLLSAGPADAVTVTKRGTQTAIACSPDSVQLPAATTTCSVSVTDGDPGTQSAPTGSVAVTTSDPGTVAGTCALTAATASSAGCSVTYTPTAVGSGAHALGAAYAGDTVHLGSGAGANVTVLNPPPPPVTVTTTPPVVVPPVVAPPVVVPPPAPKVAAADLGLPSTHTCLSRRQFTVHLRVPRGETLARARVVLSGKTIATLAHGKHTIAINLKGRPKASYKLQLLETMRDGREFVDARTYHTCSPKHASTPKKPHRG